MTDGDKADPGEGASNIMQKAATPPEHPVLPPRKTGVLMVNLGTPDAPTAGSVRKYLAEFLSDRRIVDYPRLFWLPLLYGVILNVRPAKTAKAYASVWRTDTNESPLRFFTRDAAEKTSLAVTKNNPDLVVDWAMRYGAPSVGERIRALKEQGCERLVIIPLYPQYSSTTTASVHDAVFDAVRELKWQPALRFAPAFHDETAYIEALGASVDAKFRTLAAPPEKVVISFHGLPERLLHEGDPYFCHCSKTARLLREHMGWTEAYAPLTFQSRFGREKWLEPATDATIDAMAQKGVKRVAVVTPGFVADCLETLEEIGIAAAEDFRANGGEELAVVPCLNSSPEMIDLLTKIIARESAGWIAAP